MIGVGGRMLSGWMDGGSVLAGGGRCGKGG